MPSPRSRSSSPRRDERRRSRSPRRRQNDERPKRTGGGGGIRWKEKRREEDRYDGHRERRLERGYRDRDRDRDGERERERERERDRPRASPPRERERGETPAEKPKKEKKEKKKTASAPAPSGEPMIVVNVNDRLGTKAAIPCLASDPIKLFKAQVAARIGRQPHEIMLKRQGERPFKDHLTLEDYGVSNGVQLDLELDTGD